MRGEEERRDDEELLASAAAGEEWALTVLYRRHHQALVRFLWGLAGGEAEDLAAETWIDASRALGNFEGGDSAFRSLLFTIGRRRAVDHARARGRRRTEPADPGRLPEIPDADDPADVVTAADAGEDAARRICALLPRDQAEVVLLRVVAGLSVTETAEVVGRSPAAVSVLQTRGLQRLARRLGEPGRPPSGARHRRPVTLSDEALPQVAATFPPPAENVQDLDHPERWDR